MTDETTRYATVVTANVSAPRNVAVSTRWAWYISSAVPMTVAMLVFFQRLSVYETSGGTVMRTAWGSTTSRIDRR